MIRASMDDGADPSTPQFEPLRPASTRWRIAIIVTGPCLWLAAIVITVAVIINANVVETGLLVSVASLAIAVVALLLLNAARRREEARYATDR